MTIELENLGPGRFFLYGRADVTNVARMLADGREQFIGLDDISVDLEQADCGNTAGLALLIEWSTWCRSYDIKLKYRRPPKDLLEMVRINDVAEVLTFSR